MSLAKRADYYPPGINVYCPEMKYAADVSQSHKTRAQFGSPALADADGISSAATDLTTASTLTTFNGAIGSTADANYGRNVTVTATGTLATGTTVTVEGEDYLGQPVTEQISVGTGMAPVGTGVKAFYRVDSVAFDGLANAGTATVGWGGALGLPYVTVAVEREVEDNVAAAAGTLTAPVFTDPQTATTGDPRGLYTPTGTLDGSAVFEADIVVTDFINSSDNGGLHGIAHYHA